MTKWFKTKERGFKGHLFDDESTVVFAYQRKCMHLDVELYGEIICCGSVVVWCNHCEQMYDVPMEQRVEDDDHLLVIIKLDEAELIE